TGGFAQLLEGSTLLTQLQQTFVVPDQPQTLSFDLVALGLEATPAGALPDAFEASLLDGQGNPLVTAFRPEATAFFNANPGGAFAAATGVPFAGRHVTLDIAHLPPGPRATLSFDLVGTPPGLGSSATIGNVQVTRAPVSESFTVTPLAGPFGSTAGIAAGD